MRSLATWCFRHRRWVVLAWAAVLVAATLAVSSAGTAFSNSFSLPNTPSENAIQLLQAASPKVSGDTEQVVFATQGHGGRVTDPAVVSRIDAMLAKVATLPYVTSETPTVAAAVAAKQVNASGTVGFARVTFDRQANDISTSEAHQLVNVAQSADAPGLTVAVAGQVAEQADKQSLGGTGLGVILAGVVLLLVFGSLFAMALPLVSALASLGTAIGIIGLLSHVMKMPQISTEMAVLVGLGVGVDYALFIVTRYRQGLMAGWDVESSVVNAVNTSGRAVLFAGIVVCIALLGMFALGVSFLVGMAVAAAIGVALTMVAALTLLPALLGFIGPRVLSRKQKRSLAADGPRIVGAGNSGFWPRWSDFIRRHPVVPTIGALFLVGLIACPFFSLRLGSSDQGNDPVGTTTRTAYDLLATGFGPGFNGPLQLVAEVDGHSQQVAFDRLTADVKAQPGVASISVPPEIPTTGGKEVALLIAYPTTSPESAATTNLIGHLRSTVVPQAVSTSGLVVYVGGTTAIFVDFANVLTSKLPLFIGLVVLLSFLLLAIVFRSLVIPLIAAGMNMLSAGAAFGILVAVFQWGWLATLFGAGSPGPVESWLPVLLFAILFGLSMDYQVFLVLRIHEEYLKSGDTRLAVRNGLAATGKTITTAALIMILVFSSFILAGDRQIKEFGLGLAGGILVDAVIIRMCIVPSIMQLLDKANWWFPAWLERTLPHIGMEAPDAEPVVVGTPPSDPVTVGSPS
jgi:RND superfamily putative drug exporter